MTFGVLYFLIVQLVVPLRLLLVLAVSPYIAQVDSNHLAVSHFVILLLLICHHQCLLLVLMASSFSVDVFLNLLHPSMASEFQLSSQSFLLCL